MRVLARETGLLAGTPPGGEGRGARGALRHAGIWAREVVAFGHAPNDLPMLAWAGHGVAAANAHPSVLAAADEIAPSNGEDGVAAVLEQLLGTPAEDNGEEALGPHRAPSPA